MVLRWSEDPAEAAVERWHLAFAPVWIVAVAIVMFTGAIGRMSDGSLIAFGLAVALPTWWLPAPFVRDLDATTRTRARALLLARNLWLAIVVFFGTYAWTHYFFDLMGMRYAFPTTWHAEAWGIGRSGRTVPVFLYPLTMAYFTTYYTVLTLGVRSLAPPEHAAWPRRAVVLAVLGYLLAMAETGTMHVEALAPYFGYASKSAMLWVGSIPYGLLFVVTFPFFPAHRRHGPRMHHALAGGLAASMAGLFVLDLWGHLFGPLPGSPASGG
ncbi:MAG: hypothetical protein D6705_03540 [Deltaproteobacteria bacterium]|nr:MAG: hypothetical protein D6705_03540 [Deltaproteobacteria bacterium]